MKNHKLLLFVLTGQLLTFGLAAQTADDLVAAGRACLTTHNLAGAYSNFNAAVTLSPTNETANALAAATRLLILPQQPAGSNFLNSLGFTNSGRDIYNWTSMLPKDTNGNTIMPTNNTSVAIAFYRTNIMAALGASRTNLARITNPAFTLSLTAAETSTEEVTVDYGDILLLQALERAAEFAGYTLNAHNFNFVFSHLRDLDKTNGLTIQRVLSDYPGLLNLSSTTNLAASKGVFTNAILLYQQASDFIRNTRPADAVRLFNLETNDVSGEAQFRDYLAKTLQSLNGPVQFNTNDVFSLYAGAYFARTNALRSLLPQFYRNQYVKNTLPDYTFGGVLLNAPACDTESFLRERFASYAGIYVGEVYDYYYGTLGQFAMIVRTNQQFTVVGLDSFNGTGVFGESMLDDDGSWYAETNGTTSTGRIHRHGYLDGEMHADDWSWQVYMYGQLQSPWGDFPSAAGYYTGTWSSTNFTPSQSGTLRAIVTADGQVFFCVFDSTGALNDGGYGQFDTTNHFAGETVLGTIVDGTLNRSTLKLTGGFMSGSGMGGTNTMSRSASVSFEVPPIITTNLPARKTVLLGTDTTLFLAVTGSPPLCYQWYSNDVAIPKATNSSLVISNVQWANDGTYYGISARNCVGETNANTALYVSLAALNTLYGFTATDPDTYTNTDGANPFAGLVLSGSTLYGTTAAGGASGNGTVFKVSTNGGGYTVLHSFTATDPDTYANTDGADPEASLVLSGGTLYGTTGGGGTNGYGTVFKVNTNGSGFTTLYDFSYDDGASPYACLVLSGSTLYGTTAGGGADGSGTVFSMNTNGSGFTTLYAFTGGTDGANPYADLVLSGSTLYGTTDFGGASGNGTVFKVNINGSGYTVLHSFTAVDPDTGANADGAHPWVGVVLLGSTLYGTTDSGGTNGYGTVFKVNTDGSGYNVLHSFTAVDPDTYANADGAWPDAGLRLFGNSLYGTTAGGGSAGDGVVFSVSTDGSAFTNLYNFTGNPDGANPEADLMLSGNTLYGTTVDGGVNDSGTIFSLQIPPSPPVIIDQPQNLTVSGGNTATFNITASGTTPLSYQWRKDGTNLVNGTRISGATGNLLTISGALTNDAGSYLVVVTNVYGQVASSNAVLRVIPTNQTFWLPDFYYPIYEGNQWVYDSQGTWTGSPKTIYRVDAASMTLTCYTGRSSPSTYNRDVVSLYAAYGDFVGGDFVPADDWYEYRLVAGGWGAVGYDDDPGTMDMRLDPGIHITNRMAIGQTISQTNDVYISGVYQGQMIFKLQLVEYTSITVPAGTFEDCLHLQYRMTGSVTPQTNDEWWAEGVGMVKKIGRQVGEDTQQYELNTASFVRLPQIITPPQSRTNSIGTAASFSVAATGTDPLNYQWQKNGTNLSDNVNISGSATTNLIIADVQFADAGSYSVVVNNDYGTVTSTPPAVLTVNDTTSPGLDITSHSDLQVVGTSAITLAGTASDAGRGDNGIASVTVNGTRATNDTASGAATANWNRGLSLSLGINTLTVIATDTRSNSATNVIRIVSDTTRPTNTIAAPTAGQRWSNAVFTVTGTAKDNVAVSGVFYQLNMNDWTNALSSDGWTNWTASLTLLPGTNTLKAYAVDTVGNFSTTNSVSFDFVVTNQLQIRAIGLGTLAPNYSNAWLEIGRNYSTTATATNGYAFTNWTISTNWIGGAITNGATVRFTMAPNLTLQATFVDVTIPTNTITAPTSGRRWSNSVFTVTGTATDNAQVSNVWYQLNGVAWSNAITANGWSNWTGNLTLTPGTNVLQAYAVDTAGLSSATNSVSFDFVVTNQLRIRAIGLGTLAPNYSNAWLEIGRNYTTTATAATNGFVFTNWMVSTNWIGGTTLTKSNLQFMMVSNLTLQVNFADVTRPTLAISSPAAGQHMTNALATVIGTASDNWKISGVWYSLNGEPWNQPATTNNWTNWTTTLKLVVGTNTIKAYALDLGGNYSTTNSRSIVSSNTFKLQLGFTLAQPLAGNGLSFNLQVSSNLNGRIQVSTNLLNWVVLTNFVGTNPTLNFRDAAATNYQQRFYRAVIP